MSLFTKIRDAGRITKAEDLIVGDNFGSRNAGPAKSNDFSPELARRSKLASEFSVQGETARREAAGMFAETVQKQKTKFANTPDFNRSKIAINESSRLDFAAVTAPHLLSERKNKSAKGQGVVSKKR